MSTCSKIFCPWQDCADKWFGRQELSGPTDSRHPHTDFFRCLKCDRVYVQNKHTKKIYTIIEYYQRANREYRRRKYTKDKRRAP